MGYAIAPMSTAHTLGNVTATITEFIKNLFPKDYFNTVTIASTIAYRYFNILNNSNLEFLRRKKPMLVIRPRIDDLNGSDLFMQGSYLTSRITDNYMDRDFTNLQPFIHDRETGAHIKYLLNRMRMFFDVTVVFDTQMQQINQGVYFKNRIRQNHPFFIPTALESNLPKEFMELIAKERGIDINNTKEFLDFLNGCALDPVTFKYKNSTGNKEYFRFYGVNIDTTFSNLTLDDGSKKDMVDSAWTMSFTVSAEFFTAGLYYYFTQKEDLLSGFTFDIVNSDKSIIPIFTFDNLFNLQLQEGWNLYTSTMFKVENERTPETINFDPLLGNSLRYAIDYHVTNGIPIDPLINVFILKDSEYLPIGKDGFEINYDTLDITVYILNKVSTYRLIITVNTLYINTLVGDIIHIDEEK